MRDLELWRRLRQRLDASASREETAAMDPRPLLALLAQLRGKELATRGIFAGLILQLCEDPDGQVRESAVSCLQGARGHVGLQALVEALDDADEGVRQAAVGALVETARTEPARLAHAAFHPRADVRRAVLQANLPTGAEHFGIYLRADPANADLARDAPWPEKSLELLFDLCRRGFVGPEEATRRLAQTPVVSLRQVLLHGYRRDDAQLDRWLAAFAAGRATMPGTADLIDRWCDAFDPSSPHAAQALSVLRQAVLGARMRRLAQRTAVSLLAKGVAPSHMGALELCIAAEPSLLACEGLAIADRREAAWALLESDVPPRKVPESSVLALFDSALVRDDDGAIDLCAAVCISGLLARRRTGTLLRHFGEAEVLEALHQQPRAWVALCHLPAESKKGTELLLGRMRNKDRARYHEMLAIAVAVWFVPSPARVHELMRERIKPRIAAAVLQSLLVLLTEGVVTLKHKHWIRVLGVLVSRANETDLRAVVQFALSRIGAPGLALRGEEVDDLCAALLKRVAHEMSSTSFGLSMAGLDDDAVEQLLRLCEGLVLLTREHELGLAKTLRGHERPSVSAWAEQVLRGGKVRVKKAPPPGERTPRRLSAEEAEAISTVDIADIEGKMGPALRGPTAGLCAALRVRSEVEPRHLVAVALFACTDPLEEIAEVLDPWVHDTPASWSAIRTYAVGTWQGVSSLPPQTHALIYRWEAHELAFAEWLEGEEGAQLAANIERLVALPGLALRHSLFEACASVCERWRYRDVERLARWAQSSILSALVGLLDSECGVSAARIVVALYAAGLAIEELESLESSVREAEPDLDDATRRALGRWIPFHGAGVASPPRRRDPLPPADLLSRIAKSTDVEFLAKMCRRHEMRLVHEACLRLVVLGREGQLSLLSLIRARPELRGLPVFLDSVALWTDMGCVAAVRVLAMDPGLPSRLRFRICLALHERGEGGFVSRALAAVAEDCPRADIGWFTRKDRGRLRRAFKDESRFLVGLVRSPHPHAYRHAVRSLLDAPATTLEQPEVRRALASFLEQGTTRAPDLRRRAAQALLASMTPEARARHPYFLLFAADALAGDIDAALLGAIRGWYPGGELAVAAADASLVLGAEACKEVQANALINNWHALMDPELENTLRRRIFDHGVDVNVRKTLIRTLSMNFGADRKLLRVADVFAWGVRRGRELTGHVFKVHMTDKRADFGFTFMNQKRIYVTALPILRGDRYGRDIVEGLILHEFGHHMYHGGKEADAVWKRAQREGLHRILNLVADEHLERNLRAIDAAYGDRLKRLAAFAFGHSAKALEVSSLLEMLLGAAFEVLSAENLGVAFEPERVEVQRGALLRELDRRGHPYARFVRALRMGLGNRARDEQLEQALALFRGGFRHLDMAGLYEVTLKLAEIYGGSQALGKVFGGHEDLDWEDRDGELHGAGVSDEAVQREVERILGPPDKPSGKRLGAGGRLAINVAEDEHFDLIETIERVPPDRERHRELARELRRYANRLREYLERLGLAHVPRRARLRGRAFDRTRAQAVVLRGDPRMLIAREMVIDTDLFIGVVVDCSGSMSVGQRMEVAHRFGVLIAEACAPLAGVDARFFGFTDSVIYDAGDQHHCAVTSLVAGGGNNDAAGLYHAAQVAAASKRKAKLLVMISDGLPTECSVGALRGLVNKLGRKGLVCAQVAVRALAEECFPHYVVIEDDDVQSSVRRFGEIVSKLVGRTLGRA